MTFSLVLWFKIVEKPGADGGYTANLYFLQLFF